jgi:superfamily I DNA/RNA helicase
VIRLEQNYRSQGNILDAANALIANNTKRLGKNLWTAAGQGDPLRVFEGGSDADEARFITEEVSALSARARAWSRSRCCTARTRSRGCWSTRCSARRSPTASTAGCASSSAPR